MFYFTTETPDYKRQTFFYDTRSKKVKKYNMSMCFSEYERRNGNHPSYIFSGFGYNLEDSYLFTFLGLSVFGSIKTKEERIFFVSEEKQ